MKKEQITEVRYRRSVTTITEERAEPKRKAWRLPIDAVLGLIPRLISLFTKAPPD